jgi:hypothetical protein
MELRGEGRARGNVTTFPLGHYFSVVRSQYSKTPVVAQINISLTIYTFIDTMDWIVELHHSFAAEFLEFPLDVQDALLAKIGLLKKLGPQLGRPHIDTLYDRKIGIQAPSF